MNFHVSSYFERDIPECAICLNELTCPVQLPCGHIIDVDCLGQWFVTKSFCPLDKQPFEAKQLKYDVATIKETKALFQFKVANGPQIKPIELNVEIEVGKLKALIAKMITNEEVECIAAFFSSLNLGNNEVIEAEDLSLSAIHKTGNQRLKSNRTISYYNFLPTTTIVIAVIRKHKKQVSAIRSNSENAKEMAKLD